MILPELSGRIIMRALIALALMAAGGSAFSSPVYKCVDAQGRTTFSQAACPGAAATEQIRVPDNRIGGTLGPSAEEARLQQELRELRIERQEIERRYERAIKDFENEPCKTFNATALRTEIVRRNVVVGMTRADAIRAWGQPTRVNGWQYVYRWAKGGSSYFYIENGCVDSVDGVYGGRAL